LLAIHGDKQQNERDWVLNEFKTGKSPIMVATDVASRGIGMIKTPLPPCSNAQRLYSSYLALDAQAPSRLRYFARVLSCLSVLSHMGVLEVLERHFLCYAREFLPLKYFPGYKIWN
jgi:hypothetical protein